MNREEYFKFHEHFCQRMAKVTAEKNHDYAGASGVDPFANFTVVEKTGICSTEQGFLTRMSDKMSRIATFCKEGKLMVKSESVQDTLLDLANYSALLAGYIESKKKFPCPVVEDGKLEPMPVPGTVPGIVPGNNRG